MTKLEALKACVWLEGFIKYGNHQDNFEHVKALERVRKIQKLIAALPDEDAEQLTQMHYMAH